MLYTCSHKNYQSTIYKTYAISGNRGKNANYQGDCFPKLAPKLSFWTVWHNNTGIIPKYENDYYYIENYYYQVLKNLNPSEIISQLDNSVLLCYEEPTEFCHRHIIAAWLELLLNISIPEVIVNDFEIIQVNRPSYIKEFLKSIILHDTSHKEIFIEENKDHEILINRNNLLTSSFIPHDLITTDENEFNFHQFLNPTLKPMISQTVYPYYLMMKKDMANQNLYIILDSGYRSYKYQQQILNSKIAELGEINAINLVAPPGASEHQTGLAFDIALIRNGQCYFDVKETDLEVIWLKENAYKYGFIMRYPKGKENITTYQFEPWHYRYVGLRLAKLLTLLNITLEEYYQNKSFYEELYINTVNPKKVTKKIKKI